MSQPEKKFIPEPSPATVRPTPKDHIQRDRFTSNELAQILSHYDLGVVERIRAYPKGSRRSPKLWIKSRSGEYLLKRRAPGHDDPKRVVFAHDLQKSLSDRGYPVPGLITTRSDSGTMVHLSGRSYEMFNYIHGDRYDGTPGAAVQVGLLLGRLHRHLARFKPDQEPRVGSYHAATEIEAKMTAIPAAVSNAESGGDRDTVNHISSFLRNAYHEAARQVDQAGFPEWPNRAIHGDCHPGNLLYRDGVIAGVLDFDSSRMEPRVIDVANAALQFSIRMGKPEDPATWPDGFDLDLIQCILAGYGQESDQPLTPQEKSALPWLVIEALIVESVVPIAVTGRFVSIPALSFLQMVERKVRWIKPRANQMSGELEG